MIKHMVSEEFAEHWWAKDLLKVSLHSNRLKGDPNPHSTHYKASAPANRNRVPQITIKYNYYCMKRFIKRIFMQLNTRQRNRVQKNTI